LTWNILTSIAACSIEAIDRRVESSL